MIMQYEYEPSRIRFLDDLIVDKNKRIKLHPAEVYQDKSYCSFIDIRAWCGLNGVYQLPTIELVRWLKEQIGNRSAIEVASGNNYLGYHLGILQTDNYIQQTPNFKAYCQHLGNAPTNPPKTVENIDATSAIKKYKPDVVVAAWFTQKRKAGSTDGNSYGADDEEIINSVETYIHIGNTDTHGTKRILKFPHEEYRFPWLVSRAANQHNNVIYIWRK